MTELQELNEYEIYVKFTVLGESPEDAMDYLDRAFDNSDIINEDGIVSIEAIDDVESISEAISDLDFDSEDFSH